MPTSAIAETPHYLRAPDALDPIAILGWVLARPNRRRVLAALSRVEARTMNEIKTDTGMPAGTIDPILGVLTILGIAVATPPRGTPTGPNPIRYTLSDQRIRDLRVTTGTDLAALGTAG